MTFRTTNQPLLGSIEEWMVRRNRDVERSDFDTDLGRQRWTDATRTGAVVQAEQPSDVTALGRAPSPGREPASVGSSSQSTAPQHPSGADMGKIVEWEGGNYIHTYRIGPKFARDRNHKIIHNPDGTPVVVDWHDKSGLNAGQAVDLGQRDERELRRWGVTDPEMDILKPLIGPNEPHGRAAKEYPEIPLDPVLVDKLNRGAKQSLVGQGARDYDAAISRRPAGSPEAMPFNQLPQSVATVIGSLNYQKGRGGLQSSPYWAYILRQDWSGLADALKSSKENDADRRHKEGDYLKDWLDSSGH